MNTSATNKPSPRFGHSAVLYEDNMIIFGGFDGNFGESCNDVYFYSIGLILSSNFKSLIYLEKQTWEKKTCIGESPSPRHQHSAIIVGNMMYVFGGHNNKKPLNDMKVLNLGN